MIYIRVKWKHSNLEDPIVLYSELDENRWEIRKVEIFADGHRDYASKSKATGETRLGIEPIPLMVEIANDPQFEPVEISKSEFEQIWTTLNN